MSVKGSLPAPVLTRDLIRYRDSRPRGAFAELSRLSGVSQQTIGRAAQGQGAVSIESWLRLHQAAPGEISPPTMDGVTIGDVVSTMSNTTISRIAVSKDGELRALPSLPTDIVLIPVYRLAGKAAPTFQAGLPMGGGPRHVPTRRQRITPSTFGVVMPDGSMEPTVREGDLAITTPEEPLEDGVLCLAVWPNRPGEAMVRRYFRYGDTVVLRGDRPDVQEIRLDSNETNMPAIHRVIRVIRETDF